MATAVASRGELRQRRFDVVELVVEVEVGVDVEVSSGVDHALGDGLARFRSYLELSTYAAATVGALNEATQAPSAERLTMLETRFTTAAKAMEERLKALQSAGDDGLPKLVKSAEVLAGFGKGDTSLFKLRRSELAAAEENVKVLAENRQIARQFAGIIAANPKVGAPTFDWNEPERVLKVDVLQDKARQLGITSQDIASALNTTVGGAAITQVRDSTYLINVVVRSREADRASLDTLRNMQIPTPTGEAIPLAALANFDYALEQPAIWRRGRVPTITVRAGLVGDALPDTVVKELKPSVDAFASKLPEGYTLATAGSAARSSSHSRNRLTLSSSARSTGQTR